MFENRTSGLAPRPTFARRLALSVAVGSAFVSGSLLLGMLGYRFIIGEAWIDAFLDAAMVLSGMGPVTTHFQTSAGKVFAGVFALYSGFAAIAAAGIIFAPVVHRFLHRFHLDEERRK